ncbi:MAG TPA: phosphoribosylanthranilate isomerase [Acetobacteraceae bacterium]|nr:phosphoribosylanthranilate isomerase [Acetobacteraceae bacterium]
MSVAVKICGISTFEALDAAAEAGADWVGFNFFPPSPRYVDIAMAASLARRVPAGIGSVGLFVGPTDEEIGAVLEAVPLDVLQVYAASGRCAAIRNRFGRPVWRAIGIGSAADLPTGLEGCDRLVLEAKPPQGANRPGGNAARFDWSILAGWRVPGPWILAGGLRPGNVAEAIRATGATAVDVSSGVEGTDGRKDPALIRAFVAASRAAPPGAGRD